MPNSNCNYTTLELHSVTQDGWDLPSVLEPRLIDILERPLFISNDMNIKLWGFHPYILESTPSEFQVPIGILFEIKNM